MLEKLLSFSTFSDIKVKTDPARLRPIDADLQVPDITKFTKHTGGASNSFEKTILDLLNYWRKRVKSGEVFLSR